MARKLVLAALLGSFLVPAGFGCRKDPSAADYVQKARTALDSDDLASARSFAELAEKQRGDYRDAAKIRAEVERRLARSAREKNHFHEAYVHYVRAADLEPARLRRADDLVAALKAAERADIDQRERAKLASRAVEADPSNVYARRRHARLWDNLGEAEPAIESYLWLWQADEAGSKVGLRLGSLYRKVGAREDAIAIFETLFEREPDNVQAAMNLAALYAQSNKTDAAKSIYESMVDQYPDKPGILLRYARFLRQIGKPDRATELQNRARDAMPGVDQREMRSLE